VREEYEVEPIDWQAPGPLADEAPAPERSLAEV
jgi:hypothetical protein